MNRALLFLLCLIGVKSNGQTTKFKTVFTNMTEVGGSFGQVRVGNQWSESVMKRSDFTAQTFNGIQISSRLALGATIGADWYSTTLITPVCAGARFDLGRPNQKNLRVFTSLDTGWGFTWLNEDATGYNTTGGWVVAPGAGFRIGKPSNANFILSLSYKRQEAEADNPLFWNELAKHESRVYNRVAIRMGVSF